MKHGQDARATTTGKGFARTSVYKKGDSQVLIHIVGPWDDNFDELKRGIFTGRTVIFKFYQCTSEDVFGNDNLEKVKTLSLDGNARNNLKNVK